MQVSSGDSWVHVSCIQKIIFMSKKQTRYSQIEKNETKQVSQQLASANLG